MMEDKFFKQFINEFNVTAGELSKQIYNPGTFIVEHPDRNKAIDLFADGIATFHDLTTDEQASVKYINLIHIYRVNRYLEQFSLTFQVFFLRTLMEISKNINSDMQGVLSFLFRSVMEHAAYFIKAANQLIPLNNQYTEKLISNNFNYDDHELLKLSQEIADICHPTKIDGMPIASLISNHDKNDDEKYNEFLKFLKSKYRHPQSKLMGTFRKGMDQIIPDFQRAYDILCEQIHPGGHVVARYQSKEGVFVDQKGRGSAEYFKKNYAALYSYDFSNLDSFNIFEDLYLPYFIEMTNKCCKEEMEINKKLISNYQDCLSKIKTATKPMISQMLMEYSSTNLGKHLCLCGSQKLLKYCCGKS